MPPIKQVQAEFYRNANNKEPVRDWLLGLEPDDRRLIGQAIMEVEFGWPLGLPLCDSIRDGIWECRCDITGRHNIARVLFFFCDGRMVLLHGFVKKTKTTPEPDIKLALKRMRKVEREQEKTQQKNRK